MQSVRLSAQPVHNRMSPVSNDNPITLLIRRSSKSTSPIIEFNSRRRKYYNHNFFPMTTVVRLYFTLSDDDQPPRSCRTTDHPTTTNLHQGCRATDADCGTRRPFFSNPDHCAEAKAKTRSVVPRAAPWSAAARRTARQWYFTSGNNFHSTSISVRMSCISVLFQLQFLK